MPAADPAPAWRPLPAGVRLDITDDERGLFEWVRDVRAKAWHLFAGHGAMVNVACGTEVRSPFDLTDTAGLPPGPPLCATCRAIANRLLDEAA